MKNWLKELFAHHPSVPADEPEVKPIHREANKMKLAEWQRTESLVEASRALANNPTYKLQMDVLLHSAHPGRIVAPLGTNPNDRIVMQARIEGYEMCLNNLEAFKTPLKLSERLEASFEPAEDQPRKK